MKKYLAITLALTMALCLCACTSNGADPDSSEDNSAVSDSTSPDTEANDDVLIVDPDGTEDDMNADESVNETDKDADDGSAEDSTTGQETPKRSHFSDADKEAAKSAATDMAKKDYQQEAAEVYDLKVTDLYNCVVTVGYKVMEDDKEILFLADYDLHYDNGQWVKTASYNRSSIDTSIYEISHDEAGALVIAPKQ